MRCLLLLACTGCFGARVSAGPVFDSRGNIGGDAVLLISMEAPIDRRTAIELSAGGGGGAMQTDANGVRPLGATQAGISVLHLDERFGIRAGAMSAFHVSEAGTIGGIGGWLGAPILLRSSSERLFGGEEKGFGRSYSFTAIGPEFDLEYAYGKNLPSRAMFSPRFVIEIHSWTSLSD